MATCLHVSGTLGKLMMRRSQPPHYSIQPANCRPLCSQKVNRLVSCTINGRYGTRRQLGGNEGGTVALLFPITQNAIFALNCFWEQCHWSPELVDLKAYFEVQLAFEKDDNISYVG